MYVLVGVVLKFKYSYNAWGLRKSVPKRRRWSLLKNKLCVKPGLPNDVNAPVDKFTILGYDYIDELSKDIDINMFKTKDCTLYPRRIDKIYTKSMVSIKLVYFPIKSWRN